MAWLPSLLSNACRSSTAAVAVRLASADLVVTFVLVIVRLSADPERNSSPSEEHLNQARLHIRSSSSARRSATQLTSFARVETYGSNRRGEMSSAFTARIPPLDGVVVLCKVCAFDDLGIRSRAKELDYLVDSADGDDGKFGVRRHDVDNLRRSRKTRLVLRKAVQRSSEGLRLTLSSP